MINLILKDTVSKLPLVGPAYAKKLEKLNIFSIEDLINHYPFRYEDYSLVSPISQVQPGETITITGKIESITSEFTKTGKQVQKAIVSDMSGTMMLIWFNQPYLVRTLKNNLQYNFSGKIGYFGQDKSMVSPEYELSDQSKEVIHTASLVPVYPETQGISSKWLRSRIKTALNITSQQIKEFITNELILKNNLIGEAEAINKIHFPTNVGDINLAKKRLAYDEMFIIQLNSLIRRKNWEMLKIDSPLIVSHPKIKLMIQSLPFKLTKSQTKSLKEILTDLSQKTPMNRLLQGDVGSGKTVIAAICAYASCLNGKKTLFMAPTEILANQHFKTIMGWLNSFNVKVGLITGSHKISPKNLINNLDIVVGTHALLYQYFDPQNLALIIIDEQHRFGVEQRTLITQKGLSANVLTMTATPIPRTVALTIFGDLDLSVIDEMPAGRVQVKTWVVPNNKRQAAYRWIAQKITKNKDQAFIVCPLIEESENLTTVRAAKKEFEYLQKNIFINLKLGLLHGKMKSAEKNRVIEEFLENKIQLLVSTPVVEVGIDIPNATIMIIEAAERFGLAQLHQLRGRIGRGNKDSYCFLFTQDESIKSQQRLTTLQTTHNGLKLAEIDMKLRGTGDILGTRQHGLPNLKIASYLDTNLINQTRLDAIYCDKNRLINPTLQDKLNKYKIDTVVLN